MRVLDIIMGVALTVVFIVTIVTARKERRLRWFQPLGAVLIASVTMPLSLLAARAQMPWVTGLELWALGLVIGVAWGFTVKVRWQERVAIGRNSILWLAFFALSYLFVYGLMLLAPLTFVALGSLTAMLPAGMGAGTNANMLVRLLAKAGEPA